MPLHTLRRQQAHAPRPIAPTTTARQMPYAHKRTHARAHATTHAPWQSSCAWAACGRAAARSSSTRGSSSATLRAIAILSRGAGASGGARGGGSEEGDVRKLCRPCRSPYNVSAVLPAVLPRYTLSGVQPPRAPQHHASKALVMLQDVKNKNSAWPRQGTRKGTGLRVHPHHAHHPPSKACTGCKEQVQCLATAGHAQRYRHSLQKASACTHTTHIIPPCAG